MKLEIKNPSDKCFLNSEDIEACSFATLMISNGKFALTDEEGKLVLPLFMFSGMESINKFWIENYGHSLDEFLKNPEMKKRVSEACKTFFYDGERTSLTNIGKSFEEYSKRNG
jgi:hypothetical protein